MAPVRHPVSGSHRWVGRDRNGGTNVEELTVLCGFAIDDMARAKEFYGEKLGVQVIDVGAGLLSLRAANGYAVLIYPKDRHEPAAHTILNFPVDDIEATVDGLREAGVVFEHYDEGPIKTNEKGIATPGPKLAWFRDPAGNILSVIEG